MLAMKLYLRKLCKVLYLKFITIIVVISWFTSMPALAQKLESEYISKINSGESIYVVTNSDKVINGSTPKFKNSVKDGAGLIYLKVTLIQPDSLKIETLDSLLFLNQISNIVRAGLLFVHGDSKTFEQSIMRGLDIQFLYNVRVVVFSWPSKDINLNGIKNFKNSKRNAFKSSVHFKELIGFMESFRAKNKYFPDKRLSMLFHSLGNSLIMNIALCDTCKKFNSGIFDNIILNSAAINQFEHKLWVEKLDFQDRIYITSNRSDFNLKGVRIFTKDGKQLGEKIKGTLAENAEYMNFSKAVGFRTPTGTSHTFFIGEVPDLNKDIYNIYYQLFHGEKVDFSNPDVFKKRKDSFTYDIIKAKN